MSLTDSRIKALKPQDKQYSNADRDGLSLVVTPKGAKLWRYRYRWDNKQQMMSLGKYPYISLSDARDKLKECKKLLANGINPSKERQEDKIQQQISTKDFTVETLLKEYLSRQKISDSHRKRQLNSLINDVFPTLGKKHIKDIEEDDIKTVVSKVADRGAIESSRKLFYSLSKLFKTIRENSNSKDADKFYEVKRNPCSDIDISALVGAESEKHYPTITDKKKIGHLLQNIKAYDGYHLIAKSLLLQAHTALRSHNIRHLEWEEVKFKENKLVIDGSKMKTKQSLTIPMTKQVKELLEEIEPYTSKYKYVFVSPRSNLKTLSDGALLGAIRTMGYTKEQFVPHGFRAMFSTIANSESTAEFGVIETQLAHSVGSKSSQAYNRADYMDKRADLMQWWSNYLDGAYNEVQ